MHDLLIDLANLCRDERLGGTAAADWARVDRVLAYWRQHINPHSRPLLISDDALARDFTTSRDRARWRALVQAGELLAVPDADPELLERARATGASVLSRDGFVGHRRKHDWVQGDAEHFFRWRIDKQGTLSIVLEPMGIAGDYTMTRAAEKDDFKAHGFRTGDLRDGPLAEMYRCTNPQCPLGQDDVLQELPRRLNGALVCPECRRPLLSRGPRPAARKLNLYVGDDFRDEISLADGQSIIVGRGPGYGRWDLDEVEPDLSELSRNHVRVSIRGGQVVVEDLSSRNGTVIERWTARDKTWQAGERATTPVTLLARDRVVLPNKVVIVQSGQRYVVPDVV